MAPKLGLGQGEVDGELELPVYVTKAVHPKAIAISNSLGHFAYTSVAQAKRSRDLGEETEGYENQAMRDADWERNMWWRPLRRRPEEVGAEHRQRLGAEQRAAHLAGPDLRPASLQQHRGPGDQGHVSDEASTWQLVAAARLFGRVLLRELDAATLAELREPDVADAFSALEVAVPHDDELPSLGQRYFELFLHPGGRAAAGAVAVAERPV